jgi:DNA helicase-2/ATP-dependent DNA helicase PcrA
MSGAIPLNPAQKAAIEHRGSPALVLAGAGSGKTRVITQRIARLIADGYPAQSIYAVTFTNKASEEMAERLEKLVGENAKRVWISTFHALGAEIARKEARLIAGGDRFVVYDAADAMGVVKEILRDLKVLDRRYDAGAILARISRAKSAMTTPDELEDGGEYDEISRAVFPRYQAALARLKALDFDVLIGAPLKLLLENEEVRERWQARVRHLLIDEFQDTNRTQLLFAKALAGARAEVFCVGDDDQAIYGWRGADIRNVLDFEKHFPGARKLALEQNYRSRQPILDVANVVIARAERAYPKTLFSDRKHGERVVLVECDNNESETKFVLETAKSALSNGIARREIGVLYRGNLLAKPLEEAFRLAGIPYRLIGGTSFYERREVKDLTAYLRLALHPEDEIAFRRVVNYPTRGIGDTSLERLERFARARGLNLLDAALQAGTIRDLDDRVQTSLSSFTGLIRAVRERVERNEPLGDVARGVADAIRLREDIAQAGPTPEVATKRWGNVEELFRSLSRTPTTSLAEARQVLARLSLRFADDEEESEDRVTLSTLHGAKGLEFHTVFFVGCDEGIIPHARTDAPKATDIAATIDASEERRLFYVGVTRAKETLYLVRARARAIRGAPRATLPSRFLLDVPREMLERRTFVAQSAMAPADLAAAAKSARETLNALKAGLPKR